MKNDIKKFILDHFLCGEGDIKEGESLFASGIVDSLRLVELIAFIEKTFAVTMKMSEVTVKNFDTLENIEKLIRSKSPKNNR